MNIRDSIEKHKKSYQFLIGGRAGGTEVNVHYAF